mgnify:CR=1 FL=1
MRGKVAADLVTVYLDRITPAYAGKRSERKHRRIVQGDHPRLCGEKVIYHEHKGNICRITPAYAGKSDHEFEPRRSNRDHPRLCGEKCWVLLSTPSDRGSPPPMRGKVCAALCSLDAIGITPAYAGKSE